MNLFIIKNSLSCPLWSKKNDEKRHCNDKSDESKECLPRLASLDKEWLLTNFKDGEGDRNVLDYTLHIGKIYIDENRNQLCFY